MEKHLGCDKKSDEELVELTIGNQQYFLCLMARYEPKLKGYIARISNFKKEDIEDLLQEIFIKVYKNLNDFDSSLKFSSWIYRIARNQTISRFRHLKSRPEGNMLEMDERVFNNIADSLDMAGEVNRKISEEALIKLIGGLDIKYKEVLMLNFFEGKSYSEISDILKKPIGTVSTLLNRAKRKLKKEIEKQEIKL